MEHEEQVLTLPTPEEVDASTDVLYDFLNGSTRVVGLPNGLVVKYGLGTDLDEAKATAFVAKHTSIPVPKIIGTYTHKDKNYIFMTRMKGKPLSTCLSSLSAEQLDSVAEDMKRYLTELRSLNVEDLEGRSFIGSVGFGPVKDSMLSVGDEQRGPFTTLSDFYSSFLSRFWEAISFANPRREEDDWWMHHLRRMYGENLHYNIVFCHADLHPSNILVEDGRVVGIVDWELSGWYPEYWEYVSCMYGGVGEFQQTKWPWCMEKFLEPYDYILLIEDPIRRSLS